MGEQIERLAETYEIHLYSSRVEDVDLSRIIWHRIPALPGPHLFVFTWWFIANHLWRWWDRQYRGLRYDLTYTPGINCLDADVICVHILFAEFQSQVKNHLWLTRNPVWSWPRIIHQRLYYRLTIWLEGIIYPRKKTRLTAISRRTAENLSRFGRTGRPIIYHGVSSNPFNPTLVCERRDSSRASLGLSPTDFCLLLIGNGWKGKGLETLLEAMGEIESPNVRLFVVGHDDPRPYRGAIARMRLQKRVTFFPVISDVECYYAASDLYVCPSLEDAFGVPPLEAMACGLPVVVSSRAGVSELLTDGVDGITLADPKDSAALARIISELYANPALRAELGVNAARTAHQQTWERNAAQLRSLFDDVLEARQSGSHWRAKGRIAVVSPFLDRRHGTERRASELVERFSRNYGYDIHIYSQLVQDIPGVERFKSFRADGQQGRNGTGKEAQQSSLNGAGRVFWHKLPKAPGPHLLNYIWWFVSNHLWRWWDRRFRGGSCDLVYTPGVNCLDADVVSVHILFSEFYRQVKSQLRLRSNPVKSWVRIIHRRIYYRLIIALENRVYAGPKPRLAAISQKTHDDVKQRWRHDEPIPVVYGGLDLVRFNAPRRAQMQSHARQLIGVSDDSFVLLMIGNDWKKKGLDYLVEAIGRLQNPALTLLVAGQDSIQPYRALIERFGLTDHLIFLPIRPDVEFYYAAADAYVCPSLEDAFAYPPFEAMACGLPVIVSSQAGVSELITDELNGLLLKDPRDVGELANLIDKIYSDSALRTGLGEEAAKTACKYTWERNANQFKALFEEVLSSKATA